MYENGTYAKLITEVALTFAKERNSIVDKDQIAADVADMIDLEKKLDYVKFYKFHLLIEVMNEAG